MIEKSDRYKISNVFFSMKIFFTIRDLKNSVYVTAVQGSWWGFRERRITDDGVGLVYTLRRAFWY